MIALVSVSCSVSKPALGKTSITDTLYSNLEGKGIGIKLIFSKGANHNHPSFAVWIAKTDSSYIQTLFVTRAVATGVFEHGTTRGGKWAPGSIERPATLPYWAHRAGFGGNNKTMPDTLNPVLDAYTGATPKAGFVLNSLSNVPLTEKFIVMVEVNQTWDWNEFWTNNKYPDDSQYKTSCQPAVVYAAEVDPANPEYEIVLKPIGHSHYAGRNGLLYNGLNTLTTALNIFQEIKVSVVKNQP